MRGRYDFFEETFDGIMVSNGPGDPKMADATVANVHFESERMQVTGAGFGTAIDQYD